MATKNPDPSSTIEEHKFSTSLKGYDKREVRAFLVELENNFRELEEWASDAKLRLQQAEYESQKIKDEQGQSVDGAIAAAMVSRRRKSTESKRNSPASIFEKSSKSLINANKWSAHVLTVVKNSCCSASSLVSSARSVMPMMPFIGVRISWLMLARNRLLVSLASSADSFACCSFS